MKVSCTPVRGLAPPHLLFVPVLAHATGALGKGSPTVLRTVNVRIVVLTPSAVKVLGLACKVENNR